MRTVLSISPVAAAALVLAGCADRLAQVIAPNQAPEVRLEQTPAPPTESNTYQYRLHWAGSDPDGKVDHFVYAIDPPSVDRVDASWTRTTESERSLAFPISRSSSPDGSAPARVPHVFAVRAVDDRGAMSEVKWAALADGNIPPLLRLIAPLPSSLIVHSLGQSACFLWVGLDPDGQFTTRPVKYKFLVLGPSSGSLIDSAVVNPSWIVRHYAPGFPGWDSTGGETTEVRLENLALGGRYLFLVTAFDEAGDYDPVFSLNKNMLRFRVVPTADVGPLLTVYGQGFRDGFSGSRLPPFRYVQVQVPTGERLTVDWSATRGVDGYDIVGYRWVLDPLDVDDPPGGASPSGRHHWSPLDGTTSVTVGPFSADPEDQPHTLYIEAENACGWKTLGVVKITVSPGNHAPFSKQLLIVDDTRMLGDRLPAGATCPSHSGLGLWPTAAELDTFLYARGDVPWRCAPEGTMSGPGIFDGYDFDTVGTRTGRSDLTVPLSVLQQYRHVVWLVDGRSATFFQPGTDPIQPQTALRYMTAEGRVNTIVDYIRAGGKVWLAGGGGGYASQINFNDPSNDFPTVTFSMYGRHDELAPGRFMYDLPHWQSEFRVAQAIPTIARYVGRFERGSDPRLGYTRRFSQLPARLEAKTPATDPLPPYRLPSQFYLNSLDLEFLQRGNEIVEEVGRHAGDPELQSTLDTFYVAAASNLPRPGINDHNVVMTYYHGPSIPQDFVFTGFSLWNFKRQECAALVDFVLHEIWGLNRTPSPGPSASRSGRGTLDPGTPEP